MDELDAIELVLGGEGTFICMQCEGEGGRVTDSGEIVLCWTCEGTGKLASNELLEAHATLGLEPPDLVSYEASRTYGYDP